MHFYKSNNINYRKGQVMLLTAIFFMTFALTICLGFINPIIEQKTISSHYWDVKNNYYLSEAGADDLIYRFENGSLSDGNEILLINGLGVLVYPSGEEGHKVLTSEFGVDSYSQKIRIEAQKAGDNKFIILDWRSVLN